MAHEEKIKEIKKVMKNYEPYKNEWGIRSEYYKDLGYLLSVLEKLAEAQQTIARQQAKIDAALSWTWNCGEANMLEVIAALKDEDGEQP